MGVKFLKVLSSRYDSSLTGFSWSLIMNPAFIFLTSTPISSYNGDVCGKGGEIFKDTPKPV